MPRNLPTDPDSIRSLANPAAQTVIASPGQQLLFERLQNLANRPGLRCHLDRFVLFEPLLNFSFRGHHRAVVPAAEMLTDFGIGRRRMLPRQKHRQHSWLTDRPHTAFRLQVLRSDSEQIADDSLDISQSNQPQAVAFEIGQHISSNRGCHFLSRHREVSVQAIESPFEFARCPEISGRCIPKLPG